MFFSFKSHGVPCDIHGILIERKGCALFQPAFSLLPAEEGVVLQFHGCMEDDGIAEGDVLDDVLLPGNQVTQF